VLAVRWYLRYGLSYRDVEEVLAERGVGVDYPGSTGEIAA
jgi:IS6 family transposase